MSKQQPRWGAEIINPESKFILAHMQGRRDECLIRTLLSDTRQRLAHVQVIKRHAGHNLTSVEIRHTHGSVKRPVREPVERVSEAVAALEHTVPNIAIIERRNGTTRLMNITQVGKTLVFSRNPASKEALGWWTLTVYNCCREHRMLKQKLEYPMGKKSTNNGHQ